MSYHVTSRLNVLGSDEQHREQSSDVGHERRDVGHERRDVAGFSSNKKVAKIQSLGLLLTSKLFLLHINHPRSSHDHIHKENTGSNPFHTKNLIFETFENMGTKY